LEQTLTAKLQILPDLAEKNILLDTMTAYLAACNFVSRHIFETHNLGQKSLNAALYYNIRRQFGLGAQMAQSAIRAVIASYKTILSNRQDWTEVKYKHGFYDLVWNRDYTLKQDRFSINTLAGRIPVKFHAEGHAQIFDGNSKFGSAKVIYKHGNFYLCVAVTRPIPDTMPVSNVVGVDLGMNFLAVSYDSKGRSKFYSGRACKQKRAKFKRVRQDLQRRGTPSARRRRKKIGQRENRWMQDVNHQVSKALVEGNPAGSLFVLEDLTGIGSVTEKVRKDRRYTQVSWGFLDLARKIAYKAIRKGSCMIQVDPAYTSQACPKCGFVHKRNRDKKIHSFVCRSCHYRSNDDRIGAMNLHIRGIQYRNAVTVEQALP